MTSEMHFQFVVIGGGIAGVTCAETLSHLNPDEKILLLTASPLIKAVTNFRKVTKTLEEFDVEERSMFDLHAQCPNVIVAHDRVMKLDSAERILHTSTQKQYSYEKLCICAGGSPKIIAEGHPHVIGIRDTETVKVFQEKLSNASRIVLVGNGGIATELAYEINGCEVIWAIKDDAITHTFIDKGASQFFAPIMSKEKHGERKGLVKRVKYRLDDDVKTETAVKATKGRKGGSVTGSALGPDWAEGIPMHGVIEESHRVHVEKCVEVKRVLSLNEIESNSLSTCCPPLWDDSNRDWPVYIELTNGHIYGCDFVVSATGVNPNVDIFTSGNKFDVDAADGGIIVNEHMQTSVSHVYAAGDVCHAGWQTSPYWLQMRLWCQARQMGAFASHCMTADVHGHLEEISQDFCFEMFAHVTRFFDFKVVLLGKFNAQGMEKDHELLVRVTEGQEYVKVVLQDGRMHGALLIGETDLEETFENLILNQMDLTPFKDNLLDPNIDIEDYFD
ncbi:hypothetical protein CAPTEDRAFT_157263 [Capitella teleta]|uniref:Pyridine nucleotide-disulfide oxidoreductase domain-containing protein 1 n=1 Tax=Capitella teleta TaxID=283909 RepID=R7V0B8_CAPTE|nr:hypothetical protein CAPTEDRAFT_157263 [Capitella teleta]|eukprot:ELU09647.1 hypothetical protein CAPTEDRAFT_157263 [Capitella teleta]